MNAPESRFYRVTTEWRAEDRRIGPLRFTRSHDRPARGGDGAVKKEQAHNRKRAKEGMRAEGWRWRIVAVRFMGTL